MDANQIITGLTTYLELIILLTFHEFAHAWMATRRGDDTARLLGRLSLNPLVHIDLIGTVLLPMFQIFGPSGVTRYVLGWAKPVPFNPARLRNRRLDETLIAMAGPAMNLALAVVLVGFTRVAVAFDVFSAAKILFDTAELSLLLCFFNLIPIPPLDGSHVMRHLVGMGYETYGKLCQYGFIAIIVVINIPVVRDGMGFLISRTTLILLYCFNFQT